MNREKGIIYVLDTVEDVQASLQYRCTNVSLRESSSWGWECQVLAKPQWEISAYLIHPLFELLFLKWTGIYSRHFRWLWLCINIGWIREISGRVLKKKNLKHILLAGIISHIWTQDSGFSLLYLFLAPVFKYVSVSDLLSWGMLAEFLFSFSSITAGCKGTVSVWPDLPPPQLAGERLFWHQICGSRQAAGKYLCACLCAVILFIVFLIRYFW